MSASISLTNAVTSGDERAVSELLAKGADVNETTSGGQTALILSVIFGHTNLVKLLIKAGADPHLRDNLGLNAIDWAQRRGLSEALDLLTNGSTSRANTEPGAIVPVRTRTQPPTPTTTTDKETISDDEKSRRWIAGLKQRLQEQELRRRNRNEALPEVPITDEPVEIETPPVIETISNPESVQTVSTTIVPTDGPIISEPPKNSPPLFWILIVITLAGSIVAGSLVTTYLYKSNQASARSAAQQSYIQKGSPELGGELVGKALSLPEAECPLSGPEPVSGTVTVRIMVDQNGQVNWARGAGGDWLMRGAATEAAMKSTFSPEKLRGRETEGTITYTFKP